MRQHTIRLALISAVPIWISTASGDEIGVQVVFSNQDAAIISAYYSNQENSHAGGKSGKSDKKGNRGLPPGISKNLARGKPLPPGIAKKFLPVELQERLPPVPDGYERIAVAGKILLVEIATQVIHDVLLDVLLD